MGRMIPYGINAHDTRALHYWRSYGSSSARPSGGSGVQIPPFLQHAAKEGFASRQAFELPAPAHSALEQRGKTATKPNAQTDRRSRGLSNIVGVATDFFWRHSPHLAAAPPFQPVPTRVPVSLSG
eukprot:COSAG03_NODE_14687_length_455_cov_2.250000_1_plen_124_part_01